MSCSACWAVGMPLTPMSMPPLENAADMGAVCGDRLKEARSRAACCGELGALRGSNEADTPADVPAGCISCQWLHIVGHFDAPLTSMVKNAVHNQKGQRIG